jgi:hypothetical protein
MRDTGRGGHAGHTRARAAGMEAVRAFMHGNHTSAVDPWGFLRRVR